MKKVTFFTLFLLFGPAVQSFAAKGYAHDGLALILSVAGFLLLIAGLLKSIDYLKRNGGRLFHAAVAAVRSGWSRLWHRSQKGESLDMGFCGAGNPA